MAQTYSAGPYMTWAHPSGSYGIEYSQPLIFEVEYLASEGYRRIPHGGIEIGGLLFGQLEGTTLRVQEFRLIECEHAFGPSFQLSERDLAKLREQMNAEKPELAELQIIGWFIAHTRSELQINDAEAKIFDEFFPDRTSITLLIKPEKFKATRFAFLRRDKDGVVERDGTANTFILPLQGRTDGGGAEELKPADRAADRVAVAPDRLPSPPTEPSRRDGRPDELVVRADASSEPVRAAQRNLVQRELSELDRMAGPLSSGDEALPSPPSTRALYPAQTAYPAPAYPSQIDELPTPRRRRPRPRDWELEDATPAPTRAESRPSSVQFAMILMIAAALGCAVGYWAYLQLPSPVIVLSVKDQQNALLVTWAPEQTREAVYAAIRVDDGPPVLLSADDRANGTTNVPANNDSVKIELIIRHWLRDSRGIIRYLRAAAAASRPQTGTSTALRGRTRP